MELYYGSSGISCYALKITGVSGSVGITEAQYNELISNISHNQGIIKIYGSEYGDGILISKSSTSNNAWNVLELLFLTCKYETDSYS